MSAWFIGAVFVAFTALIYYSFKNYSLKKALLIASCSWALVAYTLLGFTRLGITKTDISNNSACLPPKIQSLVSQDLAIYLSEMSETNENTETSEKKNDKHLKLKKDSENKQNKEFIQKANSAKAIKPNIDYLCVGCETAQDQSYESKADPICGYSHPRRPLLGRILSGYKQDGNEGINIAVPEGTQVKASDAGTVVYVGNELKNYGNMIIIKHLDGFTSIYAHNSELIATCGDQVNRGQTIARSGSTGNVGSPQLHFELRKGSQPVDPMRCLAGPFASNSIISRRPEDGL